MGAKNIPAWHYARLSELAYRDPATLRLGHDLPPGWRYAGPATPPGSNPANVQVSVFVNDAERVVVGAERGTVPSQIVPDMVPNNLAIAREELPRGAPPTEQILRRLGDPRDELGQHFIGYDIVGAGHSEGGANSAVAISQIRGDKDPETRVPDPERYYAVGINTPHNPYIANDANIVLIRTAGDPVSSGLLGPAPRNEITLWSARGAALDEVYRDPTAVAPVPMDPTGLGHPGLTLGNFGAGLSYHDIALAVGTLRQPEFADLAPWDLIARQQADPQAFLRHKARRPSRARMRGKLGRYGGVWVNVAVVCPANRMGALHRHRRRAMWICCRRAWCGGSKVRPYNVNG